MGKVGMQADGALAYDYQQGPAAIDGGPPMSTTIGAPPLASNLTSDHVGPLSSRRTTHDRDKR